MNRTNSQSTTRSAIYEAVFHGVNDAIVLYSMEDGGRVLDANPRACELFGCTYEEMLEMTPEDASSGEGSYTGENALLNLQLAFQEGAKEINWHCRKKDGSLFWAEASLSIIIIEGVRHLLVIFRDVTEKVTYKNRQKIYKRIFSCSEDLMSFIDTDQRYVAVNKAYMDYFQLKEEEIIGKRASDLVDETRYEKYLKPLIDRAMKGETVKSAMWVEAPQGKGKRYYQFNYSPYYSKKGALKGVVINVRDHTDWRLAEEHLKELNGRLEKMVEEKFQESIELLHIFDAATGVADMGVIQTNLKTGKTTASKSMNKIFNAPDTQKFDLEYLRQHLHVEDVGRVMEKLETLKQNPGEYSIEYRIVDHKGNIRDIHETGGPVENSVKMVSLLKDITCFKQMEKIRMDHLEMLYKQQKHRSLKEMFKQIAHQWRQPLNVIALMLDRIVELSRKEDDREIREMQNTMMQELGFLSRTINHFNILTREDRSKSVFEIRQLIEEELELFWSELASYEITLDVEGDRIEYEGYRFDFMRIVHALITNAKESIQQRKKSESLEGKITINVHKRDEMARISIKDNGLGMSDEIKQKAFDPYFTTKFNAKGVGLSLSICQDDLEKLFEGTIEINNTCEEGIEVLIELPLMEPE